MRNDEDFEIDEELEERQIREEERWIYRDEQAERMREVGQSWRDFV